MSNSPDTTSAPQRSFRAACAGVVGSQLALVMLYPLDQLRLFAQISNARNAKFEVKRSRGSVRLVDLYAGLVPMMQSSAISNFVYFYAYVHVRDHISGRPVLRDLVAALVAGVLNVLLTAPLWRANSLFRVTSCGSSSSGPGEMKVAKVNRLNATTSGSEKDTASFEKEKRVLPQYEFFSGAKDIVATSLAGSRVATVEDAAASKDVKSEEVEGARSQSPRRRSLQKKLCAAFSFFFHESTKLWVAIWEMGKKNPKELTAGVSASLLLVFNPVIQFVVYHFLKRLKRDKTWWCADENDSRYFVMGLLAKLAATLATYPLQIAQSRIRIQKGSSRTGAAGERNADRSTTTSTFRILQEVYRNEGGFRAFYAGMEKKMLHSLLNSAFMFFFYEKVHKRLFAVGTTSKSETGS